MKILAYSMIIIGILVSVACIIYGKIPEDFVPCSCAFAWYLLLPMIECDVEVDGEE